MTGKLWLLGKGEVGEENVECRSKLNLLKNRFSLMA